MEELFAVGTPDEVIEQIAEFRDHGMRYLVVEMPVHPTESRGCAATTPYIKVVRGLGKL